MEERELAFMASVALWSPAKESPLKEEPSVPAPLLVWAASSCTETCGEGEEEVKGEGDDEVEEGKSRGSFICKLAMSEAVVELWLLALMRVGPLAPPADADAAAELKKKPP